VFTPKAPGSLAGRVSTLTLRPLSAAEIQRGGPCGLLDAVRTGSEDLAAMLPAPLPFGRSATIDLIVRGGFPEIRPLNGVDRMERYEEYVSSIGADPAALSHLLESFVFRELEKSLPFLDRKWGLYHWRNAPREVDIVAEAPAHVLALFEIKASMTEEWTDFRHVDWCVKDGPGHAYKGIAFIVYLGDQVLSFGSGRIALPLSMFWSYSLNPAGSQ
jgi:predicted AAA+ superfamily ATPase